MILFYLLVTVLPLTVHPLWSMFVGDFTVVKYLGLVCVFYAAGELLTRSRSVDFFGTWQARLFLAFVVLVTLSFVALSRFVALELSPTMVVFSLAMMFFTTLVLVNSLSRLLWTLVATIGGLAFASLYVLREFQKYYSPSNPMRPGWVVGDPNYFTLSAVLCIPLAFALMQARRPRWLRPFSATCVVLMILAVTVAASRGGFLGLSAAFIFVLWRSKERGRNILILLFLVLPVSVLAPISPLARLVNPSRSDTVAADTRYVLWDAGIRMFKENWLTGVGVGNFKTMAPEYEEGGPIVRAIAHNTYIQLAAELGIGGIGLFVASLIATFRSLQRTAAQAARLRSSLLYRSATGLQGGIVGYAVGACFVSAEYQRLLWFMVFVSVCLSTLTRQILRRALRAAQAARAPAPAATPPARQA